MTNKRIKKIQSLLNGLDTKDLNLVEEMVNKEWIAAERRESVYAERRAISAYNTFVFRSVNNIVDKENCLIYNGCVR